jgi:16S rRNA (cytidine1402-2'-O)-methyltransferase
MKTEDNNITKAQLFIVSTPIGNRNDISARALDTLKHADIIACEDTRHTGQLLKGYEINNKHLESYHEHNENDKAHYLVNEILNGKSVALVTDCGTPMVSDPGYRIVIEAINKNISIVPIPGPTAFIAALTASGFAVNQFHFYGFPPQKKGRKTFLEKVSEQPSTSILYESPYKILKLLSELALLCGEERKACVSREITKIYEEHIRGTLAECRTVLAKRPSIKGEFVLVLEGKKE